jgi:hypothetical protein
MSNAESVGGALAVGCLIAFGVACDDHDAALCAPEKARRPSAWGAYCPSWITPSPAEE